MTKQIDDMLEPGEQVLFRARPSRKHVILFLLGVAAAMVALPISFAVFLHFSGEPWYLSVPHWPMFLVVILLAQFAVGHEVAVTDRRLLERQGLLWPRFGETPLGDIRGLHRVLSGRAYRLGVEVAGGETRTFESLPNLERFAAVLARATGLAPPEPVAANVLTAIGRVFWFGLLGALAGIAAAYGALIAMVDLEHPTILEIFALALLLTTFFPVFFGLVPGWLFGSLLGIASLRERVTAPEMQDAIRRRYGIGGPSRHSVLEQWTRPALTRLAGIVYGAQSGGAIPGQPPNGTPR